MATQLELPSPYFKISYEDEFQRVEKHYKTPTTVTIDVPVEVFIEVLLAAGWQNESIVSAFQDYIDSQTN